MLGQTIHPPEAIASTRHLLAVAEQKYKQRDYRGALADYNQAISLRECFANEIDPTLAVAYCGRGLANYRLGDKQSAQIDYNYAIELDPTLSIAYFRRGYLRYLAKDFSSAIADYNKAIEYKPDFALAYSNRGYAYRELYGEQEAMLDWRYAAKLFKEQGNIEKHQGMMLLIEKFAGIDSCASGMLW